MNRATHIGVVVFTVIFAIAGMSHGFFELQQGNKPTDGFLIEAIAEEQQYWEHGSEAAFTLLPTFSQAGVATILISILLIVWSVRFLYLPYGAFVLLVLFILLFLVGGGIAQIIFFPWVCLVATRINTDLRWWKNRLPKRLQRFLRLIWSVMLIAGTILILIALYIAVYGYFPGFDDADQLLIFLFILLLSGFACFLVAFVSGFARDIHAMKMTAT
ncbi:MAG: hypothetical protein AAFR81_27405 [Chloroflexota bacterium]